MRKRWNEIKDNIKRCDQIIIAKINYFLLLLLISRYISAPRYVLYVKTIFFFFLVGFRLPALVLPIASQRPPKVCHVNRFKRISSPIFHLNLIRTKITSFSKFYSRNGRLKKKTWRFVIDQVYDNQWINRNGNTQFIKLFNVLCILQSKFKNNTFNLKQQSSSYMYFSFLKQFVVALLDMRIRA